jgi:hypothetical protein
MAVQADAMGQPTAISDSSTPRRPTGIGNNNDA